MSSAVTSSTLQIAERSFSSRFFLGTGKFSSNALMLKAIAASKTQLVTMALRRIELDNPRDDFLSSLARSNAFFLPNTSGARTAEEAIRLARMARTATQNNWVKLEVTPEPKYLLPDPVETLKATATLVKEGFVVLPYINCDPILAKQLEAVGAATVMPLASPIGSNQGINNLTQLKIIIEMATVPVIVDAGIGAPSHAAQAMELGADAVLVNTAVAVAKEPEKIAVAFSLAIEAGRMAFLAKLPLPRHSASPSAPLTGTFH